METYVEKIHTNDESYMDNDTKLKVSVVMVERDDDLRETAARIQVFIDKNNNMSLVDIKAAALREAYSFLSRAIQSAGTSVS